MILNLSENLSTEFTLFVLILFLAIIILYGTKYLLRIPAPFFFLGLLGIVVGLVVGSLISAQFTNLPGSIGVWFPPIINVFITIAFLDLFLAQGRSLSRYLFRFTEGREQFHSSLNDELYVIDTSVLIDGRISRLVNSGFLTGLYLISNLVTHEMKSLSDDQDPLKKIKGRRGLDTLTELNRNPRVIIELVNQGRRKSTDDALVELAKEKQAKLITADIALAKIANLAKVETLNLAELVESLKPIIIPGEELNLYVHEAGKTKNQGVSYLTDGTMVIIENAKNSIGRNIDIRVDKIHQTATGTIIFAKIKSSLINKT